MVSVFLQNIALILVTLLILFNHKADYTLYLAIAAILIASVRIVFVYSSGSAKVTLFLLQSFLFSLAIWYVFFPKHIHDILNAF